MIEIEFSFTNAIKNIAIVSLIIIIIKQGNGWLSKPYAMTKGIILNNPPQQLRKPDEIITLTGTVISHPNSKDKGNTGIRNIPSRQEFITDK